MTEPEVAELMIEHAMAAMTSFTIYLTLTFGYLTALHFIGSNLSRMQSVFVLILYVAWAVAFALTSISHLQAFESYRDEFPDFVRSQLFHMPWVYYAIVVSLGGILICMGYYLTTTRKSA